MTLVLNEARGALVKAIALKKSSQDARSEALAVFAAGFFFVAPVIKHQAFSEEQEWRLVLPAASVWDPRMRFRDGGTLLTPYLSIALSSPPPIRTVFVGPTPHPDLEARATSGLLTTSGLPEAKVQNSTIPYRLW